MPLGYRFRGKKIISFAAAHGISFRPIRPKNFAFIAWLCFLSRKKTAPTYAPVLSYCPTTDKQFCTIPYWDGFFNVFFYGSAPRSYTLQPEYAVHDWSVPMKITRYLASSSISRNRMMGS